MYNHSYYYYKVGHKWILFVMWPRGSYYDKGQGQDSIPITIKIFRMTPCSNGLEYFYYF